jgi:hypothetical protein
MSRARPQGGIVTTGMSPKQASARAVIKPESDRGCPSQRHQEGVGLLFARTRVSR